MERLALNVLIEWDKNPRRKFLLVYGVRQIGKMKGAIIACIA